MTSSGMSSHGTNGLGSTMSITGHLIVVVGLSIGTAVDRSCTLRVAARFAGADCTTTTTAATRAHSTANSRNLVAMAPPLLGRMLFAQALIAGAPAGEFSGASPSARR